MRPIVELGVAEAYELLTGRYGQTDIPPLLAIENEDWGRDLLLSRLHDLSAEALASAGLCHHDADAEGPEPPPAALLPPFSKRGD